MHIWEILGIEATNDIKKIKTAYAAKAKEWHPEEHPEEFKQLQNAYKAAIQYAKRMNTNDSSGVVVNLNHLKQTEETQKNVDVLKRADEDKENKKADENGEQKVDEEEFDYEEVETANWQEIFFREFFSVAWNPYLMNHLTCWKVVLGRPEYQKLLEDDLFRKNFVLTACHNVLGFQKKTYLFFDRWLKSKEGEAGEETKMRRWRRRTKGRFCSHSFLERRCVTKEHIKMHEIFLAQMKWSDKKKELESEEDIRHYLAFYLPYAAKNQAKIEKLYWDGRNGKIVMSVFSLGGVLVVATVLSLSFFGGKSKRDVSEAQDLKMRIEEIKKYNENNFDGDKETFRIIAPKTQTVTETETKQETENVDMCTVTFLFYGSIFNQREVPKGTVLEEMMFTPQPRGYWNFDFSTVIEEDTTIEWVGEDVL